MEYDVIKQRMDKAVNHLIEELDNIRAGRVNPAILNKVQVEYYGVLTPLNQVGTISVPEARQILITPWDKTVLSAIEKAINKNELGLNPLNDGVSIRLVFPELNEERRKELAKECRALGEEAKIAIRNIRRDAMDIAKGKEKLGEIREDELEVAGEEIQKITDNFVKDVDNLIENKEKEIKEI